MKLHSLFSDHMVLQRGVPVPVRGEATPGSQVQIKLAGRSASATADATGQWCATLDPLDAGGPHELRVTAGDESIVVRDVMVGEVWLCSGQSNMQMVVSAAADAKREIAAADFPGLRMFSVPVEIALEPRQGVGGQWRVCSPQTVASFSATAYYFGRELHRELGVPIGLINASTGHTPAEAWTSRDAMASDSDLKPILDRWDAALAEHPEARTNLEPFVREYERQLKQYDEGFKPWYAASREARRAGRSIPTMPPPPPQDMIGNKQSPTVLFNAMIAPLVGYPIRGTIWYQGETNAIFGRSFQYRKLLPTMVADWRARWGQGDFPFLYVQLANHQDTQCEPAADLWAELRDAQLHALRVIPNAAMVVAIDLGESDAIHPKNKQDVGRRLALAALAKAYGRDVIYSGPIYRGIQIERMGIRVFFDHVDGGLVVKGDKLRGFTLAGRNGLWHKASAVIDGDTVVVSSPLTRQPVAVRYAWSDDPPCTLYNRAGLPASPFRSDDWPVVSQNAR